MISYNSLSILPLTNPLVVAAIFVFAALAALWFRGSFWNYLMTLLFTGLLAILVAFAFPLMELILDAILQEKLKKVGERVRQHHKILKDYYESRKPTG
jgi:TctA family transporter